MLTAFEKGDLLTLEEWPECVAEFVREASHGCSPICRILVSFDPRTRVLGHTCSVLTQKDKTLAHEIMDYDGDSHGWYIHGGARKLTLSEYLLHKEAIQAAQARFPPLRKVYAK